MEGRSVINILKEWEGMCQEVLSLRAEREVLEDKVEYLRNRERYSFDRAEGLTRERDELKAALVDALNTLARAVGDGVDAPDGDSGSHCETCLHEPKSIMEHPCNVCMYRYASRWTRKRG